MLSFNIGSDIEHIGIVNIPQEPLPKLSSADGTPGPDVLAKMPTNEALLLPIRSRETAPFQSSEWILATLYSGFG